MLTLNKSTETLLLLLQNAFLKSSLDNIDFCAEDYDWDAVCHEAEKQSVFLPANNALQSLPVPEDIKQKWSERSLLHRKSNIYSLFAISEMDRVMRSGGFPYIILKGLSSASFYPEPFDRSLGDVDFLIDPDRRESVEKAFTDDGYINMNTTNQNHVVFQKPAQNLEMHFRIQGIPSGKTGEAIRNYIKEAVFHPVVFQTDNGTFLLPQPKYHGLIILLHMQHHMLASGIGLRHLMDWACFVDRTWEEPFWEKELLPLLCEIGLFYYARVMTCVCATYLKTAAPVWCGAMEEALCDAVMEDILTGGNFGRKNEARAGGSLMLRQPEKGEYHNGRIRNLWSKTIDVAEAKYPVAKNHPVLLPAAVAEVAVKRVYRDLTGKRIPLYKRFHYAGDRQKIYDQLKIFQVTDD